MTHSTWLASRTGKTIGTPTMHLISIVPVFKEYTSVLILSTDCIASVGESLGVSQMSFSSPEPRPDPVFWDIHLGDLLPGDVAHLLFLVVNETAGNATGTIDMEAAIESCSYRETAIAPS